VLIFSTIGRSENWALDAVGAVLGVLVSVAGAVGRAVAQLGAADVLGASGTADGVVGAAPHPRRRLRHRHRARLLWQNTTGQLTMRVLAGASSSHPPRPSNRHHHTCI
jgi:hypothetical protein